MVSPFFMPGLSILPLPHPTLTPPAPPKTCAPRAKKNQARRDQHIREGLAFLQQGRCCGFCSGPPYAGWMVSTGSGELLTTFSATDPNTMRSMPRRPWVPMTMSPQPCSLATLTMASGA